MTAYLRQNFELPVTLVGHNVSFDQAFLRKLASENGVDIESVIAHRSVDTHSLLFMLHLAGQIEEDALTSSGAFRAFGIGVGEGARHTAIGDAQATRALVLRLLERFDLAEGGEVRRAAAAG